MEAVDALASTWRGSCFIVGTEEILEFRAAFVEELVVCFGKCTF